MAYTALDQAKPTTAQTRQAAVDAIRTNQNALRDAVVAGGLLQGFDYSTSGGTAEQPALFMFKRGAEWVRLDMTWGTSGGSDGNVVKAIYYYSSNSGVNYDPMADISGNYVLTLSYDSAANLTAATWGSVP